ncbi:unnamed protein product, partial [Linum tenue]
MIPCRLCLSKGETFRFWIQPLCGSMMVGFLFDQNLCTFESYITCNVRSSLLTNGVTAFISYNFNFATVGER